eukprot:TRINITY_DN17111_c0_g1_i1.p1 TRINITY_DN17111_c0_g1~~TRINITY_DN17111_c0_g1_i1.p1  ORF type:complete len:619 (+),score=121.51 TRINITY_DN17111_c0_g1_i1:24-1859(+)
MPKKRKGPDPAAIIAEQNEIMKLTREYYLKAFRKEHVRSAGHRNTHKDTGILPGFDPQPYPEIENVKLDRLVIRRGHKNAWEDQGEDDVLVIEDRDVAAHQDFMRSAQHDVNDYTYQVMSTVDGVTGRADMEVTDDRITEIFEAVDRDGDVEYERDLGINQHSISPRADDTVDMIDTLTALWDRRTGTLMEELTRHLRITPGTLSLLTTAVACRYLPANPKLSYVETLVLFLYTTDPVGLDRLLGHWTGHTPPANYRPLTPHISRTINTALINRDLRGLADWVNFLLVLGSACSNLPPDKLGRTLYYGVKRSAMGQQLRTVLKQSKADDIQYWPYLVSASLDMDVFISDEHEAVFTIRGAKAGLDLTNCSQSPQAMEVVLPPFSVVKVKSRSDNRKVEVQIVGSLLGDDVGDIPELSRIRWKGLVRGVKSMIHTLAAEFQLLQFYQMSYRRAARHKLTASNLSQLIAAAEAEAETAALITTDRSRAAPNTKTPVNTKPDDSQALLDAQKAQVLEKHLQWVRNEQARLERELRALKGAISDGTEDLLRAESEGTTPDPTLRPLLKARTEYYNELVSHYDTDTKRGEDLQLRISALKPADASRKSKKSSKKAK